MEKDTGLKKNQPELLVDWNGNPVQHAWMMGGKTIQVAAGETFTCESTLMRVCNVTGEIAHIKLVGADYSQFRNPNTGKDDEGLPIMPNSCEVVGVFNSGQVYEVVEGTIEVTFVFDRRTPIE